jgi:hypothetical protein
MCSNIQPITDVGELQRQLVESHCDYLLQDALPANRVRLVFAGPFKNGVVAWNACIETIEAYARYHPVDDDPQQFIDIRQENDAYWIHIGLNVQQIDQAVIERSIIMVRNYRRLSEGRHEYGARSKTL